MPRPPQHGAPDQLREFVEQKQRNIVWPDPMVNGRDVDSFLWHGSAHATRVQRAGAAVFGLAYITGALMFFVLAVSRHSALFFLVSIPFLLGGWKVFGNALPYRWKDQFVPVGMVLLGFGWLITFLAWPIFHH